MYINGLAIREARIARGYSTSELATRTGMSRAYLSLLEQGKRTPSSDYLTRISTELNVPIEKIRIDSLGESNEPVSLSLLTDQDAIIDSPECVRKMSMSLGMVMGLIHGWKCELRNHVVHGRQPPHSDIQAEAKVMLGNGKLEPFTLGGSLECCTLVSSSELAQELKLLSQTYCEPPHVEISQGGANSCTHVWFSDYLSTFARLKLIRKYAELGHVVEVNDPTLRYLWEQGRDSTES